MSTTNAPRTPEAADPVSVLMFGDRSRLSGSVAFSGLEKGEPMNGQGGLTANPVYHVKAEPSADVLDGAPVAAWVESPMIICRWCGFMVKFGRGDVEYLENCNLCKSEVACD